MISIQNLQKIYDNKTVVDISDLQIPRKTCFAFLGANGAGKSTTLLMILQLIQKTSGNIQYELDLNEKRHFGYLPENSGYFSSFSAVEQAKFFLTCRGIQNPPIEIVHHTLKWAGLEEKWWNKTPKTFSQGMRQRLGIALAFIGNPPYIILDEPLSNIDPLGRDNLLIKFKLHQLYNGATIIFSSHVISEVEQIADYLVIMDHGKVILEGDFLKITQEREMFGYELYSILPNELLKTFFEHFEAQITSLCTSQPKLINNKIIVESNQPFAIKNLLENSSSSIKIRPLSGTLKNIYYSLIQ